MNVEKFLTEIKRIFQVAFVQKAFKVILRSAWVGGAVYLLFWGIQQMFGIFSNSIVWLVAGFLTAGLSLASLYFSRAPDNKFVWRLDRRFDMKEQVVTAFELFANDEPNKSDEEEGESIEDLLAGDAAYFLPGIRRRVAANGWNLRPEIESTLVVLILLLIVYLNGVSVITQIPPGGMISILPVLEDDPTAAEVFGGGGSEGGQPGLGNVPVFPVEENREEPLPASIESKDCDVLSQIFRGLGDDLEDDSMTYFLADSLKDEDYMTAAEDFGYLAENVARMSEGTRNKLASEFLNTAVALQDAGQNNASIYFQDASAALYDISFSVMSESLDELANLMQSLVVKCRGVDIVSDQAILFEVNGENETVQMPGDSALSVSDLGESQDYFGIQKDDVQNSTWQSTNLLLEDIDVVSTYFSTQ